MKDLLLSSLVLLCSSIIVILFHTLHLPASTIQKIIVVLLLLVILIISSLRLKLFANFFESRGKWYLLLIITVLIQQIIYSTGGLSSPFFILIHLCIIGISLLLGFNIAILFFTSVILVLMVITIIDQNVYNLLLSDPAAVLLYVVSFLAILPLAKAITDQYKSKERFSKILENQINVEESILENLNELVFVVDTKLRILSINEAVEQTLRKTRGEMMYKYIFDVLYLRDASGNLVTQEMIFPEKDLSDVKKTVSDLRLPTTTSMLKVTFVSRPIMSMEGKIDQISIILNPINAANLSSEHNNLGEAKARYNALIESLKSKLSARGLHDLHNQLLLINKADSDIEYAQTFEDHPITQTRVRTDIAVLCRQIVYTDKEFAQAFNVDLSFEIIDFGEKDIAPLIHKSVPVSPEQLTGPFFTAECDIKLLELLIQKLLDIAVLLSSTESHPKVTVSIKRDTENTLLIKIATSSSFITIGDQNAIFTHDYKGLPLKKNLALGSGLEGHLASTVATNLNIPLAINRDVENSNIYFTITIPKKQTASTK